MSLSISTDATFPTLTSTGLALVDFWAEWCGPCKLMLPRLEDLSTRMEGVCTIAKHDVDSDPQVPSGMRIMSIPTMILFKDGKPVEKFIGVQEIDVLVSAIEKHK